jgi:hypothetical protein
MRTSEEIWVGWADLPYVFARYNQNASKLMGDFFNCSSLC